jgi:hypothetical protein
MMRKIMFGAALAALGFATAANASLVTLTFVPFGGGIAPPIVPKGETAVTLTAGTGQIVTGSVSGDWAAPAYPGGTPDPNPYLALETGESSTIAFGKSTGVEIYIGSLDSYNTITFNGVGPAMSFTGATLAAMASGGAMDNGNQTAGSSNGLFYFVFSPDEAVTSVTLGSTGNSLEVAGISVSSIPEPATWAMMLIGFTGLGYTAFRRSAKDQLSVKPI